MPELPEVEAVAIALRPLVEKRKIRSVVVFHPIAVLPQSAAHVSKLLTGRRIESVQRKGKYLFLVLDNGAAIEMHFRFDGHLIHLANAKEVDARANKKTDDGIHIDVALEFDKGVIAFADGRHLGRVHAWESLEVCPPYNELGVDAMSPEFTAKAFLELVSKSRRPLKEFLLDQSRIAGVGNIYSCEALWHAKISLPPRQFTESERSTHPLQGDRFGAAPRAEALPQSSSRFQRLGVVVPGHRRHSSRLPAQRRTLQTRWASDQTNYEGQSLDLFLRALSEVAHRDKTAVRHLQISANSLNLITSAVR